MPDAGNLHAAVLQWTELRRHGPCERPALQLYNFLRNAESFRRVAPALEEGLNRRLECIERLAETIAQDTAASRPQRLTDWLQWAEQLVESRESLGGDWETLLESGAEEDNLLLQACVSQSLHEAATAEGAHAGLIAAASVIRQADARRLEGLSLPPAEGRRLDWRRYFHRGQRPNALAAGKETNEALADLLDQVSAESDEAPPTAEGESAPRLALDTVFIAAQREFTELWRLADLGWPIETDALVACATLLRERLVLLARRCGPHRDDMRQAAERLTPRLDAIVRELTGQPCPQLEGDAPDHAETAAVETRADQPPRDETPPRDEPATPRDLPPAMVAPWVPQVLAVVDSLAASPDPEAQEWTWRVQAWLDPARTCSSSADTPRRVLSCLLDLDDRLAQPGRSPPWMTTLQAQLRDALRAEGRYTVLDRQLLGRPIASCSDLADAVGYVDASLMPRHIARIVQPGYAAISTSGSQEVLRRAKVLLAR